MPNQRSNSQPINALPTRLPISAEITRLPWEYPLSASTFTPCRAAPSALAFNGKKAAQSFYATDVPFGQQAEKLAVFTSVFVLPSTSGAASGFWDIDYWHQLAEYISA